MLLPSYFPIGTNSQRSFIAEWKVQWQRALASQQTKNWSRITASICLKGHGASQRTNRERTPNSVYSYHSVGYGKVCSLWFLTVAKKTVYSPFVYRHFLRLLECLKSKFYSEKLSSVHVFAHIVVNPCLFSPEALTVSTLLCCIFPDILNILPC